MTSFDRGVLFGACLLGVVLIAIWTAYQLIQWWREERSWKRHQTKTRLPLVTVVRDRRLKIALRSERR